MSQLERRFGIRATGSTPGREIVAGLTTFATLSYILFVQPSLLSGEPVGMDAGGVLFATCVASALACFAMAFLANLPIALAPAMGHNVFFAFVVCGVLGFSWREALAANLCAGALFLVLSPSGLRERVMRAIPEPLERAIGAGIGLLIAMVGLQWSGIVVAHPATYVTLGELARPEVLLALFGLALSSALLARRVPGAFLIGMLGTALVGVGAGAWFELEAPLVEVAGVVGAVPSPRETAFGFDLASLFARPLTEWLGVVAMFLFLDLFDTIGSLLGLARQAELMRDGRLPRARGAFAADALGTTVGACLGTSTVTTYVESSAGIAAGGRTGLVALTCGVCFLAALFLEPLIAGVGGGVLVEGVVRQPVVAPVLILIGALMMRSVAEVDWKRVEHGVPAFLTMVLMPLTFSITDGIAWGVISYVGLGWVVKREERADASAESRGTLVLAALFLAWYGLR